MSTSMTQHPNPAGLSTEQAARQRALDGPNELPRPPQRTAWRILLEAVREPMFQLLGAAVAIYLVLGDVSEAAVLLAFLAVIVSITVVQERRTERVLEALHDMTSPRAQVWRDGQRQRVAGTELVLGDRIELTEGDRVPADARLLLASDLALDESLLSGESLPVSKSAVAAALPGQTDSPAQVFAGTLVVAGQAVAEVSATGARSEIGRMGLTIGTLAPEVTPLHQQTRQLVRWFSVLGLAVSLVVAGLFVWTRGDWLGGALAGITMAMSMLPQEFVLILTVFTAMGAWRLSQQRILTRRAATIETLGAATVLCTDKTGTLTQNRMAVAALVRFDAAGPQAWQPQAGVLPPDFHALLSQAVLASEQTPRDPMERALDQLAPADLKPAPTSQLVHEYGLSPAWPVMTHVWQTQLGAAHAVAAKGAPESVVRLCQLPDHLRQQVLAQAAQLADQGMRVLGVASGSWTGTDWPADQQGFDWVFQGLVAFADPLRDSVVQAVEDCRRAGIRVVMITGDHPGTAQAIARQAGMDTTGNALRGDEVAAMDEAALQRAVGVTHVFARVAPQQKLRIVQALKRNGEVVAMTGDGVNDAPSLKAAHIGIAMGGRGTDVAREASSLVLLDDDFGTLVQAVRLGRRTFDNLRKAMRFVFAVHVPIAGLTLVPLVLGWPLLFTPMHIAFLEIVIDPICSIVFEAEAEEGDVMNRPPRSPTAALFSPAMVAQSLLQGAVVLGLVGVFYWGLLQQGSAEQSARAAAFMGLIFANIALILVNRSQRADLPHVLRLRNRALWVMVLVTLGLLGTVLGLPPLRALFGFALPDLASAAAALGVGVLALLLLLVQNRLSAGLLMSGRGG